jgi:chemotaxis protein CheX
VSNSGSSTADRLRRLMDETVLEVFATMLGCECIPGHGLQAAPDHKVARITFSGALAGECVLIFADMDAAKLAEMFLGEAADDAMADDAMGELCNVLAGGWKRRLRPPASGAGLSVPSVARETSDAAPDLCQGYEFDGRHFAVRLTVDLAVEY